MSNPWAQSFEELRSPYLQEKKAKKDYDGDGEIESGTDEYKGSVDKAIKKSMAMKGKKKVDEHHQKDDDGNVVEHGDGTPASLDEVSDKLKKSYIKGATKDIKKLRKKGKTPSGELDTPSADKVLKRKINIGKTMATMKKEEVQLEAKVDTVDPKNKRKRRNEVSFGKQTKPYDPPGKAYKNEMGKFLQKQRKERHDKNRGVKTKGMGEEVVLESDKKGKGSGSKDACYHKVKSRYDVWPSAYASGALVKCRKAGAKNWGNSSKKEEFDYYQMPMKSFGDIVGECWKTHERVPGTVKGAKGSCRPKGSAKIKEDHVKLTGDAQKEYEKLVNMAGDEKLDMKKRQGADAALTQGGHSSVLQTMLKDKKIKEAVKHPRLDIEKKKVNNKIEVNPELKTEAAKAPVKK